MGLIIVSLWTVVSVIFAWLLLAKITPKEVDLGDFSCSKPTYGECLNNVIKPRVKSEIKANLTERLKNIKEVSAILRLPLEIIEFEIFLVNKNSGLWLEISDPEYREQLSPIDLRCIFADKNVILENNRKNNTGENLRLDNLEEDSIKDMAENIVNKFGGCDLVPKEAVSSQPNRKVARDGIVSFKKVLKPHLAFQTSIWEKIFIFLGLYTIIGGILALTRQTVQVYKRGIKYFSD